MGRTLMHACRNPTRQFNLMNVLCSSDQSEGGARVLFCFFTRQHILDTPESRTGAWATPQTTWAAQEELTPPRNSRTLIRQRARFPAHCFLSLLQGNAFLNVFAVSRILQNLKSVWERVLGLKGKKETNYDISLLSSKKNPTPVGPV